MFIKYCCVLFTCSFLFGFVQSATERATYENYRVYRINPSTQRELETLKALEATSDSLIFLEGIQLVGRDVEVVVAPHKVPDFLTILEANEIDYELLESNLEQLLATSPQQISSRSSSYDWTNYYTLDSTYQWLQKLAIDYPSIVTLIEGGKSYQGRSILGVKIDWSKGTVNKPGIFLEAGIHAREWISPATSTYIINQLLTSTQSSVRNVAENYVFYIFPHTNPDGYEHTTKTDRMWRKTRAPYGNCFGADPNRNWDFFWNTVGASSNPCSDTYAGPVAFSEIETRSLSKFIASLKGKIQLYISFHSYSQYLLYPYGHTNQLPDNIEDFRSVFNVSVAAISKRYSTKYTGGNVYDAIYPASGSSADWAYGVQNVRMSFTYELRPSSTSYLIGFRLPANQIIPTGEETLDSVVAMIGEVKRLGYFNV